MTPKYLYKVLSIENWEKSQNSKHVLLPAFDDEFIHFSTDDQLEKIITKFWGDSPEYVILKVETKKLSGYLVLENNPGGTTQYYHLYNGTIYLESIVESTIIKK